MGRAAPVGQAAPAAAAGEGGEDAGGEGGTALPGDGDGVLAFLNKNYYRLPKTYIINGKDLIPKVTEAVAAVCAWGGFDRVMELQKWKDVMIEALALEVPRVSRSHQLWTTC